MKISIRRPSPRPLVAEPVVAPEPLSQRRERNDLDVRQRRAVIVFTLFVWFCTAAFIAALLFARR